jgi:uncharacterized membrane protein YgdD (TMEM256/DUF423 family)
LYSAALSAGAAVTLGGLRGHLLDKRLPKERLPLLEVGMRYQLFHSIAMMLASYAMRHYYAPLAQAAGITFGIGIIIFSLAMYGYAILGKPALLKLSPLGGLIFLVGWVLMAMSAM